LDSEDLVELRSKFTRWLAFHVPTLIAATIHALSLPEDILRASSHILRVKISLREREPEAPQHSRLFAIELAEVVEQSVARSWGGHWPVSIHSLTQMRLTCEAEGRGTVAAVVLESDELGVQIVPVGSLKDLRGIQRTPLWKTTLLAYVEKGTKYANFTWGI